MATPGATGRETVSRLPLERDRCAGHLPAWFEVRGGLPRRGPAAQALRRHAWPGSSHQARARRRGAGPCERGPTLHGFSPRRLDRYAGTGPRQRACQHAPRVPSPVGQLRADLLRPRGPGAGSRSSCGAALCRLADDPPRPRRAAVRPLDRKRSAPRCGWRFDAAVAEGLLNAQPGGRRSCCHAAVPVARGRRASGATSRAPSWCASLDEVPAKWRPLFELLAATGLRISEAVGLRWSDLGARRGEHRICACTARLSRVPSSRPSRATAPRVHPADAVSSPSLYGPIGPHNAADDAFVFVGRDGSGAIRAACAAACSSLPPSARD